MAGELQSLDAAIREAQERLATAKRTAAVAADRDSALPLRAALPEFNAASRSTRRWRSLLKNYTPCVMRSRRCAERPTMSTNLEPRIATALADDDIASDDLASLIAETETAIINGSAPPGEHRRMLGVELTARGIESFSPADPPIAKGVQLLNWM
jgi:hypothetical protein